MDKNLNFAEQVLETLMHWLSLHPCPNNDFLFQILKEKVQSEDSGGRVSDLIDDEDVLMEDDFYTTNSGRQVRRRRSVPDQKTSGLITDSCYVKL